MIWHIFRKDLRLLWPLALAVALIQLAVAAIAARTEIFYPHIGYLSIPLTRIDTLLGDAVMIASALLLIALVHQEVIPSLRQDWLIRPVKRSDLLLAKVLFAILLLHGPMMAADLLEGLWGGFTAAATLGAAASRSAYLLATWTLPVMAIASMTANVMEAVVGLAIIWLVPVAFDSLTSPALTGGFWSHPADYTGLAWVPAAIRHLVGLAYAVAILLIQYVRRQTSGSRLTIVCGLMLSLAYGTLSWPAIVDIQQSFSPVTGASDAIDLSFAPDQGRYKGRLYGGLPAGAKPFIPLRVNPAPGWMVAIDRSEVRIIGRDGNTLFQDIRNGGFDPRKRQAREQVMMGDRLNGSTGEQRLSWRAIDIPGDLYARLGDEPVRLEMHYFLTLFRNSATTSIPALDSDHQWVPDLGFCWTKPDVDGNGFVVGCRQEGDISRCFTAYLETPETGRLTTEFRECVPDYSPYDHADFPDAQKRIVIPFRNWTTPARFPANGSLPPDTRIVFATYQPVEHFTRDVIIPEIRLKDWEPAGLPPVRPQD